ncbi:MAG: META domain-containing protein [Saprospiraceae bacterium]|nr:META domain-containing protein [Saprospiraceae bacterium]
MKWNNMAVFLMVCFTLSCHKDNKDCVERIDPDCVCTLEYDPVCGCNDVTYSNACHAECANIKEYNPGECPGTVKTTIFGNWNFIGYLSEDAIDLDLPIKKHTYEIYIEFSDEKNFFNQYKFSGKAPVNTYGGLYSYVSPVIIISNLVSTEIAGSPAAMAYESKYYQALNAAESFEYFKEVLLITTGFNAGKDRMVFVKRS